VTPLSAEQLAAIMPRVDAEKWADPLNEAMARFLVNTPQRAAQFLAHVAHESDECRRLTENLRYTAARLCQVWPKRFRTLDGAAAYANNPEKLANFVYANRMGNGDEASGDGWRYRGRGLMQITGRANYRECANALGLLLVNRPELLEQPVPAALAAAWFWESRGCNALADSNAGDNDDEDFVRITVLINGGRNGLAHRRAYWAKGLEALS
jgi:putative chitinase